MKGQWRQHHDGDETQDNDWLQLHSRLVLLFRVVTDACLLTLVQGAHRATDVSGVMPLPGVVLPGMGLPGFPAGGLGAFAGASRIVVLKNAVEIEELQNTTDYEEIVQDMQVRLPASMRQFVCCAGAC
jgi:hypothetical protein